MIKKLEHGGDGHPNKASKPELRAARINDVVADILKTHSAPVTVPESLIRRSFKKGSVKELKDKLNFLLKIKDLDALKKKFLEKYELLAHGVDTHYRTLHSFEIMFFILQEVDPDFLHAHSISINTLKQFFGDTLLSYIGANIANFIRGERDSKKLRKVFQFQQILLHYDIPLHFDPQQAQYLEQMREYLESRKHKK